MTTDVATADTDMTYKRVARLMTDRRVNAVPVDNSRKVLGMVSEGQTCPRRPSPGRNVARELARAAFGPVICAVVLTGLLSAWMTSCSGIRRRSRPPPACPSP